MSEMRSTPLDVATAAMERSAQHLDMAAKARKVGNEPGAKVQQLLAAEAVKNIRMIHGWVSENIRAGDIT